MALSITSIPTTLNSEQNLILSPTSSIKSYCRFAKALITFNKHPNLSFKKKFLPQIVENQGDISNLRHFLNKHKDGEANYTRELRTLIMSSHWIKKFI